MASNSHCLTRNIPNGHIPLLQSVPAIGPWEANGIRLSRSLTDYFRSCQAINTCSLEKMPDTKYLVSRIDDHLNFLNIQLENQIRQSRQILVRARNTLAATFYSIPHEILAEIFTLVVCDRGNSYIRSLEDDVRGYYHRLYSLLGVCSVWRNVGLSHAALWTLIPIMSRRSGWLRRQFTGLSVHRAGSFRLHLAASLEGTASRALTSYLSGNFSRFQSINIVFDREWRFKLPFILYYKLPLGPSSQTLKELSLYHIFDWETDLPWSPPDGYEFLAIHHLLRSLRIFRIKNVYIRWPMVMLPNLIELCVESVAIGTKSDFRVFILAISTAPQLQKLRLMSLYTTPDLDDAPVAPVSISLPCLQRLYVGDMYSDDLQVLLRAITPSSYYISLDITDKTREVPGPDENIEVGLASLLEVLWGRKVDTLMVRDDSWENRVDFGELLQVMPLVTTLKIELWEFGEHEWEGLARPTTMGPGIAFASLKNVLITSYRLVLVDAAFIERFLASHHIQQFSLGGGMYYDPEGNFRFPIERQDHIVHWFRSRVPNFQLLHSWDTRTPPEFQYNYWDLWQ